MADCDLLEPYPRAKDGTFILTLEEEMSEDGANDWHEPTSLVECWRCGKWFEEPAGTGYDLCNVCDTIRSEAASTLESFRKKYRPR